MLLASFVIYEVLWWVIEVQYEYMAFDMEAMFWGLLPVRDVHFGGVSC